MAVLRGGDRRHHSGPLGRHNKAGLAGRSRRLECDDSYEEPYDGGVVCGIIIRAREGVKGETGSVQADREPPAQRLAKTPKRRVVAVMEAECACELGIDRGGAWSTHLAHHRLQ